MRMFHYLVVMLLAAWPAGAQVISGPLPSCTTPGPCGTNSPLGFQQNNLSVLNQGTAAPSAFSGPALTAGAYAGAGLNMATAVYPVDIGYGALQYGTVNNAENTALGTLACQMSVFSFGVTCIGEHALGWDWNASNDWLGGNDAGRNVYNTSTLTGTGNSAFYAGSPTSGTATGFEAQQGNSSAVTIGGASFFAGDTVSLIFTPPTISFTGVLTPCTSATCPPSPSVNSILTVTSPSGGSLFTNQTVAGSGVPGSMVILAQLTGSVGAAGTYLVTGTATVSAEAMTAHMANFPITLTYTLTGSDTTPSTAPAHIAAALQTLFANNAHLGADNLADFGTRQYSTPDARLAFLWPGTAATGYQIVVTASFTGTGSETATIGAGANGTGNNATGSGAMLGIVQTTAQDNNTYGNSGMPSLTAAIGNNGFGFGNFPKLAGGNFNVGMGDGVGGACITCSYSVFLGGGAGLNNPSSGSFNFIACMSQQSGGCDAGGDGGANLIFQGNSSTGMKTINCANTTNPYQGSCTFGGLVLAGTTKFTVTGCSISATTGVGTSGSYTSGTSGTCTAAITINGATGMVASKGWVCTAFDQTNPAVQVQTVSTTTGCTVAGATTSGDIVVFSAFPA